MSVQLRILTPPDEKRSVNDRSLRCRGKDPCVQGYPSLSDLTIRLCPEEFEADSTEVVTRRNVTVGREPYYETTVTEL